MTKRTQKIITAIIASLVIVGLVITIVLPLTVALDY